MGGRLDVRTPKSGGTLLVVQVSITAAMQAAPAVPGEPKSILSSTVARR